eukprot:TRINITY_DN1369_c0_g1_i1.p1 TRINITY_DN1369_c0_g1~~TRINITY_DN1369_c0_g1_i1.p1  ORF type:complete len:4179 (+),score=776.41 TRINITY_DN1369_c0_g1_i1:1337-12538(+)
MSRRHRGRSGHLAVITSAAEQANLLSIRPNLNIPLYIGAQWTGALSKWDTGVETGLDFTSCSVGGPPPPYCLWAASQPSGAAGAVAVNGVTMEWTTMTTAALGYWVEYARPGFCDNFPGGTGHCYDYVDTTVLYNDASTYHPKSLTSSASSNMLDGFLATISSQRELTLITQWMAIPFTKVHLPCADANGDNAHWIWATGPESTREFFTAACNAYFYCAWASGAPTTTLSTQQTLALQYPTAGVEPTYTTITTPLTTLAGVFWEYYAPVMVEFVVNARDQCVVLASAAPIVSTQYPKLTDIVLVHGDRVEISTDAFATWEYQSSTSCGPAGVAAQPITVTGYGDLSLPRGCLVGRIGAGDWFCVGLHYEVIVTDNGGALMFGHWDDSHSDNIGQLSAYVQVYCAEGHRDRAYCMPPPIMISEVIAGRNSVISTTTLVETAMELVPGDFMIAMVPRTFKWITESDNVPHRPKEGSSHVIATFESTTLNAWAVVGKFATSQYRDLTMYSEQTVEYSSANFKLASWDDDTTGSGQVLVYLWVSCDSSNLYRWFCGGGLQYPALSKQLRVYGKTHDIFGSPTSNAFAATSGLRLYPSDSILISSDPFAKFFTACGTTSSGTVALIHATQGSTDLGALTTWSFFVIGRNGMLQFNVNAETTPADNCGYITMSVVVRCGAKTPPRFFCARENPVSATLSESTAIGNAATPYVYASRNVWATSATGLQLSKALSEGEASTSYASAQSMFGQFLITGDMAQTHSAVNAAGAAYLYDRNGGNVADQWSLARKLTASIVTQDAGFGTAVAIDGDSLLIGAPGYPNCNSGTSSGAVFVFSRNSGGLNAWQQVVLKCGSVNSVGFGFSVAISGNSVLVGAPGYQQGQVYYVKRHQGGTNQWGTAATITGISNGDLFGYAVAFNGRYALVGAPGDDLSSRGADCGSAYLYSVDDALATLKATLRGPFLVAQDKFGSSVALNYAGQIAAIGCAGNEKYVYVFANHGAGVTASPWVVIGKYSSTPTPTTLNALTFRGQTVMSANTVNPISVPCHADITVLKGGSGTIFGYKNILRKDFLFSSGSDNSPPTLFRRDVSSGVVSWVQEAVLLPLVGGFPGSSWGFTYAFQGNLIAIGAVQYNNNRGRVDLYTRVSSSWGTLHQLYGPSPADGDRFGAALAIWDQYLYVGTDSMDSNQGKIFVYDMSSGSASLIRTLLSPAPDPGMLFASHLCAYGGLVATRQKPNKVYVFGQHVGGVDNWGVMALTTSAENLQLHLVMDMDVDVIALADFTSQFAGFVMIYTRNHGGANSWGETKKLTSKEPNVSEFGSSLALSAGFLAVGIHSGTVQMFHRHFGGTDNWGYLYTITVDVAADTQAHENSGLVAMDWPYIVIGSPDYLLGTLLGRVTIVSLGCYQRSGYMLPDVQAILPIRCNRYTGCGTVTLIGRNLNSIDHVWIGSQKLTSLSASSNGLKIIATMPAATMTAGYAALSWITNAPDAFGELKNAIRFVEYALPQPLIMEPASAPRKGGRTVTIQGFNFATSGIPTQFSYAGVNAVVSGSSTSTQLVLTLNSIAATAGTYMPTLTLPSVGSYQHPLFSMTLNPDPVLLSVVPASIPANVVGRSVTLSGTGICATIVGDLAIQLAGVAVASINPMFANQIIVVASASPPVGPGDVNIVSLQMGDSSLPAAFTYNPLPLIASVFPTSGLYSGGTRVTIIGSNTLGASDITQVTLDGIAAAIVSQTPTQVIVTAASSTVHTGDVVVVSTSFGTATQTNGWTYNPQPTVTSVFPPSAPSTGGVTITVTGTNFQTPDGYPLVVLAGASTTTLSQTSTRMDVQIPAHAATTSAITMTWPNQDTVSFTSFTINPPGVVLYALFGTGAQAGGVPITIYGTAFGTGSDISAVTLDGVAATLGGQSSSVITVTPAAALGDSVTFSVFSREFGVSSVIIDMTVRVVPDYGPTLGCVVTVSGQMIGDGTDIATADVSGSSPATILSQSLTSVVLQLPAFAVGLQYIRVLSGSVGYTYVTFTFHVPVITSIVPNNGPRSSGGYVTITGSHLGDGTDVLAASIKGVTATIVSQSANCVTVLTGAYNDVSYLDAVLSDAPVGYWRLGESSGTQAKEEISNRHGTYHGPMVFGDAGAIIADANRAARFTRSASTYVITSYFSQFNTPTFSYEVWCKLTPAGFALNSVFFAPVGNRDGTGDLKGFMTYFDNSKRFQMSVGCNSGPWRTIVDPATPDPTQWHHLVGSYNGSALNIYVNGVHKNSFQSNCYVVNPTYGFQIGAGSNERSPIEHFWDGNLDEVALYNFPLTAAQIANHYRLGKQADVWLESSSYGPSLLSGPQYTYNPAPAVSALVPDNGLLVGMTLTITGTNLNSGNDMLNVTIGGVETTILSQSSTAITIQGVRAAPVLGLNTLVTTSLRYGVASLSNAFFLWSRATITAADVVIVEATTGQMTVQLVQAVVYQTATSVTVPITVPTTADCAYFGIAQTSLIFVAGSWNTAQSIAVTAARDYVQMGNVSCTIQLGPSTSDKPQFSGITKSVVLTMTNIDTAAITLHAYGGLFAFPSGFAIVENTDGWYSIALHSKPTSDVQLQVTLSNTKLTANTTTIMFHPNDWNITQQVFLAAPQDNIVDGLQWIYVTLTCQTSDPIYAPLTLVTTLLRIDVDGSDAFLSPAAIYNTTEDAQSVPVYCVLAKIILSNVTVTPSASLPQIVFDPPVMVVQPSQVFMPLLFQVSSVRNFIAEGAKPYSLYFAANGSDVDQTFVVSMWNIDVDNALLNVSRTLLNVNELGTTDSFSVGVTSLPVGSIVLSVSSSNSVTCAKLSLSTVTFTVSNWRQQIPVVVTGLRNPSNNATDQTCNIIVRYTSGDPAYAGAEFLVAVRNHDIHWPRVYAVSPPVAPLLGRNMTVRAYDALPGVGISVAGAACVNVTFDANYTLYCQLLPVNVSAETYQNMTVVNPDGGWQVMVEVVFLTNDCPFEGLFGRGLDCHVCTVGGYCPGGYRIWPLPGWFSFSEFDARVYPCTPPEACAGGRTSDCETGYQSDYCAQCATNYWRADQETCDACGSQINVALLLMAQFFFVLFFLIAALFVNTETLGNITFVVNSLRALWIVTGDLVNLPSTVSSILSVLSLFAADMNFSQPGCSGVSTFLDLWLLNVCVVSGAMGLLAALLYLQFRIAVRKVYRDETKRHELAVMQAKFSIHVVRAMFTYFMFIFAVVFTKGFQGVNCIRIDNSVRLSADLTQVCFTTSHAPVFLFSLVLILVTFLVPIMVPILCKQFHNGGAVNAVVRGVVLAAEDEFKQNAFLIYCNSIFIMGDVSLGLLSEVILDDGWRSIWQLIILSIMVLFVVIVRPFNDWWKTCGATIIYLASLLAVIHPVLGESDIAVGVAWVMVAMMLLFAMLALMVCMCHFIRRNRIVAIAKRQQKEDGVVQVPSMNMGTWDDDTIQTIVQDEGRIATVEAVRHEIKEDFEQQQADRDAHAYKYPLLVSRPQEDKDEDDILRLMRRLSVLPTDDLKSVAADRAYDVRVEDSVLDSWLPSALLQRQQTRRASLTPGELSRRMSVMPPTTSSGSDSENESPRDDNEDHQQWLQALLQQRRASSMVSQTLLSPPGSLSPIVSGNGAMLLGTPVQQASQWSVDALVPRAAARSLSRLPTIRSSASVSEPDGVVSPRRLSVAVGSADSSPFSSPVGSRRDSLAPLLLSGRRESVLPALQVPNSMQLERVRAMSLAPAATMLARQRLGSIVQEPKRRR